MDNESLKMKSEKKIKSSFCTNVMPKANIPEAISILANLGYDGVELWDNFLMSSDVQWLKNYLLEKRIRCSQICPYFDFTGGKEKWNESIKIAEKYIEISLEISKPIIRIFTGHVSATQATSEQWKNGVEGLKKICAMGLRDGIRFALETHGGSLMESSDSTLRLLEEVGKENIGVNLQIPFPDEDIWESIEKLGKHTIHVHAHSWLHPHHSPKAQKLGEKNLTFLDSGWLDFKKFVDELFKKGFSGYISIEHSTHGGIHTWMETAEHEIKFLKSLNE